MIKTPTLQILCCEPGLSIKPAIKGVSPNRTNMAAVSKEGPHQIMKLPHLVAKSRHQSEDLKIKKDGAVIF